MIRSTRRGSSQTLHTRAHSTRNSLNWNMSSFDLTRKLLSHHVLQLGFSSSPCSNPSAPLCPLRLPCISALLTMCTCTKSTCVVVVRIRLIVHKYPPHTPNIHSYIGAVEKITDTMVVYDEGTGFVTREIGYVPGLFKIFDEILGTLCVHVCVCAFGEKRVRVGFEKDTSTLTSQQQTYPAPPCHYHSHSQRCRQ